MTTATFDTVASLAGQEIGVSDWVEITQDRVNVLTDMAIEEQAIDEGAAEAAVKRAEEALKGHELAGEEAAAVQASLAKSLAQLQVKRRHRRA